MGHRYYTATLRYAHALHQQPHIMAAFHLQLISPPQGYRKASADNRQPSTASRWAHNGNGSVDVQVLKRQCCRVYACNSNAGAT